MTALERVEAINEYNREIERQSKDEIYKLYNGLDGMNFLERALEIERRNKEHEQKKSK